MISCPIIRISGIVYERMRKYEPYIFLLFLLVTLSQLWLTYYVPSLDGPQHLYNASVLSNLWKENELVGIFFDTNSKLVGYWTSHILLSFFTSFLPSWLAEKFFLTLYVLAIIFSFRYLVHSINKEKGNFVSYLIFPFVFHSFILMGYYAFSLAGVVFYLAFGYYYRNRENLGFKEVLIFSLILIILFFTHGLIFLFFALSFFLFYFGSTIHTIFSENERFRWRSWWIQSLKLLFAVAPSFIFWLIYTKSVITMDGSVANQTEPFKDLLIELFRIRQLVGFHHETEALAYIPIFVLLLVLSLAFIFIFYGKIKSGTAGMIDLLSNRNVWTLMASVFLGIYFFAPGSISGVSLTDRYGLYFFLLLITWLSMQKFPRTLQLFALIVILYSISFSRIVQHGYYKILNDDIAELVELKEYIAPNSLVDYQRASNNWTHRHFQLYSVLDKPIVHLRNTQCNGQFPMVWAYETLPECYAGTRRLKPSGTNEYISNSPPQQVDYVTVFFNSRFWNDSTELEWQGILREYYEEVYLSSGGKAALYKRVAD
jgi:hypothetical protein